MTALNILCFCGCGQPRRDGSKYFSEACQRRMDKLRYNAKKTGVTLYNPECACGAELTGNSIYCPKCRHDRDISLGRERRYSSNPYQHGATVWYHDVGLPDHMTQVMALDHMKHGNFEPGDVIKIGDRVITISSNQQVLF